MDLAYDGAPFHGFARQAEVRTVQGEVEAALTRLFGGDVTTVGAGRTDAGVHALGQVMSTQDAPYDADPVTLRDALNGMCWPSIAITSCRPMPDGFHARFSARSRTYVYALLDSEVPDPFLARTAWRHGSPLDVEAMTEAAGHLIGEHDFRSFGRVENPEASAVRTLYELSSTRQGAVVRVTARANAFVHQMVRSLVGTLVWTGQGRLSPQDVPEILQARDRARAAPVAPPQGLCLVSVEYDEGWSRPMNPFAPPGGAQAV